MDKRALLNAFAAHIAADLSVVTQAALAAREAATHVESKAEDQYDTRGIEASYLAGAQSKRAAELQALLALYTHLDIQKFDCQSPIASTAVVKLQSDGEDSYYLLMPNGGGMSTTFEGKLVHVVTPQSPLGGALLGRRVGDQIEIQIQRRNREYDIVDIW